MSGSRKIPIYGSLVGIRVYSMHTASHVPHEESVTGVYCLRSLRYVDTCLYSMVYNNNSFHVPDVRVVCCLCTIVLPHEGHNPVVRGPEYYLLLG